MATDSFDVQSLPWADISLGPIDTVPLERLYVWQNDPVMRNLTMGFRFPVDEGAIRGWLDSKRAQNGRTSVTFAIVCGDHPVGVAFLNDIDWLHRRAALGIYIGDADHTVRGTGSCALALVVDYAIRCLGLNRVFSYVTEQNEGALKMNQRVGLRQEGVLRDHYFVSGKFVNVLVMGLMASEFDMDFPDSAHRQ